MNHDKLAFSRTRVEGEGESLASENTALTALPAITPRIIHEMRPRITTLIKILN